MTQMTAFAVPSAKTGSRVHTKVGDTVDFSVCPSAPLGAPVKLQEPESALPERAPKMKLKKIPQVRKLEKGKQVGSAVDVAATATPTTVASKETAIKPVGEVSRPPSAQPDTQATAKISAPSAEPPLCNGLPTDTKELCNDGAFTDTRPDATSESSTVVKVQEEVKEVKEPPDEPPPELSAEVADDWRREKEDEDSDEHDWPKVAPGRSRVLS